MTKRLLITIDGRQYDVTVEVLDQGPPAPVAAPAVSPPLPAAPSSPPPIPARPVEPASVPASAPASGPGDIPSPLTGRVVAINVQVGQPVKAGDCVVVLEAMKMNTNVIAPRDGTVSAIKVAVGDAAEEGQTLISMN